MIIYCFKYNLVILVAAVLACLPWKAIFGKLPEKLQYIAIAYRSVKNYRYDYIINAVLYKEENKKRV